MGLWKSLISHRGLQLTQTTRRVLEMSALSLTQRKLKKHESSGECTLIFQPTVINYKYSRAKRIQTFIPLRPWGPLTEWTEVLYFQTFEMKFLLLAVLNMCSLTHSLLPGQIARTTKNPLYSQNWLALEQKASLNLFLPKKIAYVG